MPKLKLWFRVLFVGKKEYRAKILEDIATGKFQLSCYTFVDLKSPYLVCLDPDAFDAVIALGTEASVELFNLGIDHLRLPKNPSDHDFRICKRYITRNT